LLVCHFAFIIYLYNYKNWAFFYVTIEESEKIDIQNSVFEVDIRRIYDMERIENIQNICDDMSVNQ
jgi:hypothetical protein